MTGTELFKDHNVTPIRNALIAGAAVFSLGLAAPATAHDFDFDMDIGDDEEFLEQLIELDANDIEDIRTDMAEAREDIREAIGEIEEARAEASETPGAGVIVSAALKTARVVVSATVNRALNKVDAALTRAEGGLNDTRASISADEYAETLLAISVIREELIGVQDALAELLDAMKG